MDSKDLHIKLLRYLTYALNHCNPIVKKFSDIALRCALSPMGANIALFRYLYDVSFDRNEQYICNLYQIHSDSEQYATIGVLRDLINCRDGINVIDYYNYGDITASLMSSARTNNVLHSFVFVCILLFPLYCVL